MHNEEAHKIYIDIITTHWRQPEDESFVRSRSVKIPSRIPACCHGVSDVIKHLSKIRHRHSNSFILRSVTAIPKQRRPRTTQSQYNNNNSICASRHFQHNAQSTLTNLRGGLVIILPNEVTRF